MFSIPESLAGIREEIDHRLCLGQTELILDSPPAVPAHRRRPVPVEDDLWLRETVQMRIRLHPRAPVVEVADQYLTSPARPVYRMHRPMRDAVMGGDGIREACKD